MFGVWGLGVQGFRVFWASGLGQASHSGFQAGAEKPMVASEEKTGALFWKPGL